MKIVTLHVGTWDSHHLLAVFSTKEKAEAYVKKFNIKDTPVIDEITIDPHDSVVSSNKIPYLASCKKKTKIKLQKKDIYDFFKEDNVHFTSGTMYYFLTADNDEQAVKMTEKMREKIIGMDWINWDENINLGIQTL